MKLMKKSFAVILAALLLLTMSTASAYDGEITFQQIPWGSSIEEVETQLQSIYGANLTSYAKEAAKLSTSPINLFAMDDDHTITGFVLIDAYLVNSAMTAKVGGYDTGLLIYVFALPVDNPAPDKDELTCVLISLNAPNVDEAIADLTAKLTQKYGEAGTLSSGEPCWYGENDTAIILSGAVLIYVKAVNPDENPYQLADLSTPEPAQTPASNNVDPSDSDGL